MRIGLTYNLKPAAAAGDQFEEFDSLETIEGLEAALRARGHEPVRLGWGIEMLDALERAPVDGVFNLAEGIGGRGRESQVPAMLEMLGIPCSASGPLAIALTLDKALAKLVAKAHGIATAPWRVVRGATHAAHAASARSSEHHASDGLRFPLFAKPAAEGSSMGITASSLCRTPEQLDAAVARLTTYGPVLIEEFLSGDEFTVGLLEGEVIGVMQVVPKTAEENFIYSLDVKRDYLNRVAYRLVDAPDVAEVGRQVWRAFGLRDVARVDVRRDRDGVPNFVEVNPLPGMNPVTSDLVILARLAGIEHRELIGRVIDAAVRRWTRAGLHAPSKLPSRTALPPPTHTIAVCYNDDAHLKPHLTETELIGEREVIDTAHEIAGIVGADVVPVRDDVTGALRALRRYEVVFNLCEGVLGRSSWEMHFGLALEMLGIRHASVDPIATGICNDKLLAKRILAAGGVRTPRLWHGEHGGRWIVKPSQEDAGIGIDASSVVTGAEAIEARVRWVQQTYGQPALVEEFIDGRELNESMYVTAEGPVLLPPGEIIFDDALTAGERVVGWKAKWASGSAEDRATRNQTPAVIDNTLRRDVFDVCLSAATLLSLHAYCRFDLRQSADGTLWIVDINPNPDIGRESGFRRALDAAGTPFPEFLRALMMAASASRK